MPQIKNKKIDFKSNKVFKFLVGIVTVIMITAMFPKYETIEADYTVGMIWSKEDLIAPFSFPIYKSESSYRQEVEKAKEKALPVFDLVSQGSQPNWLDSLNRVFTDAKKASEYENLLTQEKNLPEEKKTANTQTLIKMKSDLKLNLNEDEWNVFSALLSTLQYSGISLDTFRKKIILSLNRIYDSKIIDVTKNKFKSQQISYIKSKVEETIDINNVKDLNEAEQILKNEYRTYFKNDSLVNIALAISKKTIYPDLKYNKEESEKIVAALTEAVPKTFGIVKENERIVSKHEPINDNTKLKLESYKRVRNEQMGSQDFYSQQGGRFLLVTIMIVMIAMFLFKMRPVIFENNVKLILISTIILFQCLFSYLSLNIKINYPVEFMIFVPVAAILLTIIFDARVSIYITIIICILVSAVRGGDYDILIPNFAASVLVVYSVRDIKNRSQIFISMVYILIGYSVSITAIGLERFDDFSAIKEQLYAASLNALLSPILAYAFLIFYERIFRVATDLVFLELSDFNHPLLRELSSKAPGTFHHSMMMGSLSEQAAKEIGANQILARVGCYYHDIGKIITPGYFVENQMDSNKHEELNPSLSAKMIISHVKNGIRLAEKYRLPKEVIDFIPMHHGTNLVSYFYAKARTEEGEIDTTHDFIYRYPGPKPQTKETGIVMLADAVEASTRSIEDPTPGKLETQIDEIIKARFIEGELDECDLTLRDLIKIKQSFLKTLVGIHHHRIKYPETADEEEK